MNRRKFALAIGTVAAGLAAGSKLFADDAPPAPAKKKKAAKHDCKGKNACKGQGGCKESDNGCAGKNSCKGKGGCDPAHLTKK
ncbi:MAG: hypothetical protein M3O35_18555 [Acidobacteriota bacterium]|jgi:hypothetical protein|nr:hypothetical protein [Acidobacteriota bacterium]